MTNFQPNTHNLIQNSDYQSITYSPQISLTVAEFFAGIGLVRLGLERAGWQTIFANDYAPDKYAMYASYFKDAANHFILDDIHQLDVQLIPNTLLATSSFPCIDLSLAGKQKGLSGQHSSAFWGFTRVLQSKMHDKPPLLLLENVPGWLTSNRGKDFRLTVQALNKLGYKCDVYALDALRFTPQSRSRIYMKRNCR